MINLFFLLFVNRITHRIADFWRLFVMASRLTLIFLAQFLAADDLALGEVAEFQINSTLSTLTLVPATFDSGGNVTSGSRLAPTIGIIQQEQNSLETGLAGTLVGQLNNGTLRLSSLSSMVALANPTGPFLPSPSETGTPGLTDNFGALAAFIFFGQQEAAKIGVRDFGANLIDGTLTIGGLADSIRFSVSSGVIDVLETGNSEPSPQSLLPVDVPNPVSNTSSQLVTGNFSESIQIMFNLNLGIELNFSGQPVQAQIFLTGKLVATRLNAPISGDFDEDGDIDGRDFLAWQRGESPAPFSAGDLADWQTSYSINPLLAESVAIPEPMSLLMLVFGLSGALFRRR